MTNEFYIADITKINMVLGVQWLNTLGPITMDYQTLEMRSDTLDGTRVVLWGMSN